jgi:hypothetical protein
MEFLGKTGLLSCREAVGRFQLRSEAFYFLISKSRKVFQSFFLASIDTMPKIPLHFCMAFLLKDN